LRIDPPKVVLVPKALDINCPAPKPTAPDNPPTANDNAQSPKLSILPDTV